MLYDRPLTSTPGFNLKLNGRHQSDSHVDLEGADNFELNGYELFNASVGVYALDGTWDVSRWGKT